VTVCVLNCESVYLKFLLALERRSFHCGAVEWKAAVPRR